MTSYQPIPGKGQWEIATLERVDREPGAADRGAAPPVGPDQPGTLCPEIAIVPPQFVLISGDGKMLVPRLPISGCGLVQPQVLVALSALSWQPVSVRLVSQIQTQQEVASGCAPQYRDRSRHESLAVVRPRGAGAQPASCGSACTRRQRDFRGAVRPGGDGHGHRGASCSRGCRAPGGPLCTLPHGKFAVLGGANGPVIYVELGGCDRVFRYESGAGGLMGLSAGEATPGAVATIESLARSLIRPAIVRSMRFMAVRAVIFDWGGTLTPWHTVDHEALWLEVCAPHFPADQAAAVAAAILAAEFALLAAVPRPRRAAPRSSTSSRAPGSLPGDDFLATYYRALGAAHLHRPGRRAAAARAARPGHQDRRAVQHHVAPQRRTSGCSAGTGCSSLIDGAVYSSEIPWTKPHPEAFRAAMAAIGVTDPASCVFVGDRPYDDIYGAKRLGMRAVLIPHSEVPPHDGVVPDAVLTRLAELPRYLDRW